MIVQLGGASASAFHVPSGIYSGTLLRSQPAKKKFCKFCSLEKQVTLYFSLRGADDIDNGYVGAATRCVNTNHCIYRLSQLLEQWLEDRYWDYVNEDGSFDFDKIEGKRADIVIEQIPTALHPVPYSKVTCVLPAGRLTE